MGTARWLSGDRKVPRSKGSIVVALLLSLVIAAAVSRSALGRRGTQLLQGWESREAGRVLRVDEEGHPALGGEQAALAAHGRTRPAAGPTLSAQDGMVTAALAAVQRVADADESLRWEFDPGKERARAAALAAMMGVRPAAGAPPARHDASLERARSSRDVVEAVRGCRSLECLREAHARPRGAARFNFPHFMLIGWQKTATTSLFAHLNRHPQVNRPWDKEPEFFSATCAYQVPSGCAVDATVDYIRRVLRAPRFTGHDGALACYEASTHYSRNGHLMASDLADLMPWLRVVASLRDPISRAASMLVHHADKNVTVRTPAGPVAGGCLGGGGGLGACLLAWSHIAGDDWGGPTNYSYPLKHWLEAFPSDQVFLLQYENLTSPVTEADSLRRLKRFLGIDPSLPAGAFATLGMNNARKGVIRPGGWPMRREQYEALVALVRPDCLEVAALVTRHRQGVGAEWMANWERAWAANLATCDDKGDCMIQLT